MSAPPSLQARAVRASVWVLAGHGGGHVLRFASNLVLTRLLVPEAFGIMAVVNSCLLGLQLFSDFGVRTVLIQHPRGDEPAFLDTAWSLQVLRGAALSLAAGALAWPAAAAYGRPELLWLLPVAGISALLQGFGSTKFLARDRHLAPGRATLITLGTSLFGALVMLVWASIRPDVWALLAGSLASSALRLLLSFVALPGRGNRFGWEPEARRELLRFGRWIFLSTLTTFVAMQADRLILGFMVPMGMLGVYAIAQTISRMPVEVLESVTQSVTFPAYSRVREKGGDLPRAFAVARLPLVWAGGLGLSLLALLGPALIGFLYDDRYREAGWIVQVLAAGALLQILHTTLADALLALGQPQWIAAGNGAKIASMAVFLPLGYSSFGFAGALGGLAAAELPKYLLQALRARRCGLRGWGVELSAAAAFAACVALPACARRWLDAGPSLRAAVAGAGFAVVWGLLSLWMGRTWLRQRRTPGLAGGML